jgi:hypothetical protein
MEKKNYNVFKISVNNKFAKYLIGNGEDFFDAREDALATLEKELPLNIRDMFHLEIKCKHIDGMKAYDITSKSHTIYTTIFAFSMEDCISKIPEETGVSINNINDIKIREI